MRKLNASAVRRRTIVFVAINNCGRNIKEKVPTRKEKKSDLLLLEICVLCSVQCCVVAAVSARQALLMQMWYDYKFT